MWSRLNAEMGHTCGQIRRRQDCGSIENNPHDWQLAATRHA